MSVCVSCFTSGLYSSGFSLLLGLLHPVCSTHTSASCSQHCYTVSDRILPCPRVHACAALPWEVRALRQNPCEARFSAIEKEGRA